MLEYSTLTLDIVLLSSLHSLHEESNVGFNSANYTATFPSEAPATPNPYFETVPGLSQVRINLKTESKPSIQSIPTGPQVCDQLHIHNTTVFKLTGCWAAPKKDLRNNNNNNKQPDLALHNDISNLWRGFSIIKVRVSIDLRLMF